MTDRVPTTDEMDHVTPDERNTRYMMCGTCFEWTKYDARLRMIPFCKNARTHKMNTSTAITERTFDEVRAKKESKKAATKARKK